MSVSPPVAASPTTRRPRLVGVIFVAAGSLVFLALVSLGVWQLHRLSWKLALIARVDARVHAAAIAPPSPAAWPSRDAGVDEYRHVVVSGVYLNDRETAVQAVTELGGGFWILTPLKTDQGFTVLVNRGFVPPEKRDPASRAMGEGPVSVSGLLRLSEPKGAFLRGNDPASDRWYSRDVAAIGAARGLHDLAPYFIDTDPSPNPGGYPVGGLTVIAFPNNHLVYALTWFALAAMLAGMAFWVVRNDFDQDA